MDYTQQFFELNPFNQPIQQTDYFMWLLDNEYVAINALETKVVYMFERFGFVVGEDHIGERGAKTLRYIEQYYFDFVVQK